MGNLRKSDYNELEYRLGKVLRQWSSEIGYGYDVMNKDIAQILSSIKDDVNWSSNSTRNMYVLDMANYVVNFALKNKIRLNKRRLNNTLFFIDLCLMDDRKEKESLYVDETGAGYFSVLYNRVHDVYGLFSEFDISHMPVASMMFVEDHFLRALDFYDLDKDLLDAWIVDGLSIDEDELVRYLAEVPLYRELLDQKKGHEFIKLDVFEMFKALKFDRDTFLKKFKKEGLG